MNWTTQIHSSGINKLKNKLPLNCLCSPFMPKPTDTYLKFFTHHYLFLTSAYSGFFFNLLHSLIEYLAPWIATPKKLRLLNLILQFIKLCKQFRNTFCLLTKYPNALRTISIIPSIFYMWTYSRLFVKKSSTNDS